tara:strand:- start:2661 stop:2840 length:180 start_codon:yes stop_codon:yes gene_type:complete
MEKVLTVVLRYDENATLPRELLQAMTDRTEVGGCKVIAASFEDEIKRVEQFEEDAITKG